MSSINASQPPAPTPYGSPPITIILAIIILVFFFFGFFSIYFCRCVMGNILRTWHFRRSPSGNLVSVACASTNQGLDPSQIQSFPTFKYSTVKDFRREKYGLECAICLSEFENESMLRLLTVCYHVFHQECIDLWLESHKTCPVCRRILDRTDESFGKASPQVDNENVTRDVTRGNEPLQDAVTIDVREDDHDHDHEHHHEEEQGERERGECEEGRRKGVESSSQGDVDQEGSSSGVDHNEICEGKLSRSHTTGHSIVRTEEDRYTLRLPDHVKCRLLRGHNWTGSCTTFGDISKNKASGSYGEAGFSGGDINRS